MDPGSYFQEGFRERPARAVPAPGEAGGRRPRTRRTRPLAAAEQPPRKLSEPVARVAARPSAAIHSRRPARSPGLPPIRCVPSRARYTARPGRPSRARSATPRPPPSPSMRVPSGLLPARKYLSPAAEIPTAIGLRPRSRPTLQGAAPSSLAPCNADSRGAGQFPRPPATDREPDALRQTPHRTDTYRVTAPIPIPGGPGTRFSRDRRIAAVRAAQAAAVHPAGRRSRPAPAGRDRGAGEGPPAPPSRRPTPCPRPPISPRNTAAHSRT